jgi:hypothetical protein
MNFETIKALQQCADYYNNQLAKLANVPQTPGCNPTPVSKKKEKDMHSISVNPTIRLEQPYGMAFNAIETAQEHLTERLSNAANAKVSAARRAFGLENDDRPRTPQSFIDRILAGKFVIPEDRKNHNTYDPTDHIIWRDPAIKKDEDGYAAAKTAIDAASDDVMDIIIVKGNEAGLEAVNAFKAKTFH